MLFFMTWIFSKSQNFVSQESVFPSMLIFNPAIAGTEDKIAAILSVKKNWVGIKNSPGSNLFNIHAKAADIGFSKPKQYISNHFANVGLGLGLYNDNNGPLLTNAVQLAYSHHLFLSEKVFLSFGLSAKLTQYTLNQTIFKPIDPGDPNISMTKENVSSPNFNFGLLLKHKKYFIGLSSTNLVDFNNSNKKLEIEEDIRSIYFCTAYKFMFNSSNILEPVAIIRTYQSDFWINFQLKYYYSKYFWLGVGATSQNLYSGTFAIKYKQFDFGYVYEYSKSKIYRHSLGNHMVFIGYNI